MNCAAWPYLPSPSRPATRVGSASHQWIFGELDRESEIIDLHMNTNSSQRSNADHIRLRRTRRLIVILRTARQQHVITDFIKGEMVLTIAAIIAILSMILVPPDAEYLTYIDFQVIAILFCLMLTVAGLMKLGGLDYVSGILLNKATSIKSLRIILVNCAFFVAMFLTNDVALIALVPITIAIFHHAGRDKLISTVVLQTVAANIGSSLTPIGNPQNLYLYTEYHIEIGDFFRMIAPIVLVGYLAIMVALLITKNGPIQLRTQPSEVTLNRKALAVYIGVFVLCILTVLRVLDYRICFVLVVITIAIYDRSLLKRVDYGLLATFVFFFIFVGNIERLPVVETAMRHFITGRTLPISLLSSQVISNVPAAMMISRFTDDARGMLLGTNIGGLGTPIASLASLISFKIYSHSEGANPSKYMGRFLIYNVSFLAILTFAALLIS